MQFIELNNYHIFYINNDIIIKKINNILRIEKNSELIDETICPPDFKNFNVLENDKYICLFFVHGEIVIYDKLHYRFLLNRYTPEKYGPIVSKIIHQTDNLCLFVTNIDRNLQIVQYDFIENVRVAQTKSWNVNHISDFCYDSKIFAVFDQAMLIACDFDGDIAQKFDSYGIKSLHINRNPFYISDKKLKNINNGIIEIVPISDLYFDKILASKDNIFFLSDANKKDIYCIDIKTKKQLWNMVGTFEILDSCLIDNYLVLATTDNIISVNIKHRKIDNIYKINGIFRLIKIKQNIICQHTSGTTFVMGS